MPNIAPRFPIKSGAVKHQRNIVTSDKIRVNASNRNRDYKTYYDSKLIKRIEEKCQVELDLFGYSFDGPLDNEPLVFVNKDFRFKVYGDGAKGMKFPKWKK